MRRAGLIRMLWRGLRRRCPRCDGRGAFFTSWFDKAEACRTCGLRWRRGDVGFELGAAAMAAILVLGVLVVAMAAALAATWPDIEVVPLVAVFLVAGVVLPIVAYPISYTVWQAIDLLMRPVEPDDFVLDHLVDHLVDQDVSSGTDELDEAD
ncbi:MAG: DUF983 domain-containing protein [Actinomycetota bacterium]